MMQQCDQLSSILKWNSEEVVIPYISPVDGKKHRYFMDFWLQYRTKSGEVKEKLVEIKPHAQRFPPKMPKRRSRKHLMEVQTYLVNQAKWEQAAIYAENRGMDFAVFDEYDLAIKKRPKNLRS